MPLDYPDTDPSCTLHKNAELRPCPSLVFVAMKPVFWDLTFRSKTWLCSGLLINIDNFCPILLVNNLFFNLDRFFWFVWLSLSSALFQKICFPSVLSTEDGWNEAPDKISASIISASLLSTGWFFPYFSGLFNLIYFSCLSNIVLLVAL